MSATAADWRYESRTARSPGHRLWVNVRSTVAVGRAVIWGEFRAAPSTSAPFLSRLLAALAVFTLVVMAIDAAPRWPLESGAPLWAHLLHRLSAAVAFVATAVPLLAFLVEVTGHRSRRGPTLGALVGVAVLILFGWVLVSEAMIYQSWADSRYRGSPLAEYSLHRLFRRPWWILAEGAVLQSLTACGLIVLARSIRETETAGGWIHRLSSMVVIVSLGVLVVDVLVGVPRRSAAEMAAPHMMFAVMTVWLLAMAGAVRRRSVATGGRVSHGTEG